MRRKLSEIVRLAQAAGEPTRLRLLVILSRGEFSVTELTEILGQSQPRVSRHLKLLGDRGLLERFREQHWIYYRVPAEGAGAEFARLLLAQLAVDDPLLASDRERVESVLEARRGASTVLRDLPDRQAVEDDLGAVLASEVGDAVITSLLYVGRSPAHQLGRLGTLARRVTGIHTSRVELQRARAQLHSLGLSHCVLKHADLAALPSPQTASEVAIVDRMLAAASMPGRVLRDVARGLAMGGRLIVVEDFDALAARSPDRNPLQLLRGWITDAGLHCRRLRPVEAGHSHLLIAVAATMSLQAAA